MMVPGDGFPPQQGQPMQQRGPMPPGAPSPVMPPHAQQMYGHRGSMQGMPGQPAYPMQGSPARQGSFTGMQMPQYSNHGPLHSPMQQQGPGMHPMQQRGPMQPHRGSLGRQGSITMPQGGMPPMPQRHDGMRSSSQGMPGQQQFMQQQRQHSSSSSQQSRPMGGSWQSNNDMPHRREMIQHIVQLLKKDKHGSPESMNKLPQMAKQLEVSLYRDAPTFEAYRDMSTLKKRLQQIAMEVSRKHRGQRQESRGHSTYDGGSSQPMGSDSQGSSQFMGNGSASSRGGGSMDMPDINNMQMQYRPSGQPDHGMGQYRTASQGMSQSQRDPDWKEKIRHKQQRLLLLHHSAKCPHEDGHCAATPHCADMKKLWRHMEGCKDNSCRVPHCFSSRAILSHYRKCKDPVCAACKPVRETVRKSRSMRQPGQPSSMSGSIGGGSLGMSNSMRSSTSSQQVVMPQPQQQQRSSDPMGSASLASASSSSSRSAMPPPVAPSQNNGQQYFSSSQQAQSYNHSSRSSDAVQPLYRPDQQMNGDSSRMHRQKLNESGGSSSLIKNDAEYQKIRHKQQRLLLLRHASRCQHKEGTCPVTPHCASMKKLWEHIAHCKNQNCNVQHCLSSRCVLSHYRRCKDPRCPACGPVREMIRKSSQREGGGSVVHSQPPGPSSLEGRTDPLAHSGSVSPPLPSATSSNEREAKRFKTESTVVTSTPSIPGEAVSSTANLPTIERTEKEKEDQKPTVDHSLLGSFTVQQLETHLASLDRKAQLPPAKLKAKCTEVLRGLQTHQHGWVFNCPVDPVELSLPDYFDIIKKPMDLGTVQKRLENGQYHSIDEFGSDVNLTFDNAVTYNADGSVVYTMAKELKEKFAKDMAKLMKQLEKEDEERRQNDRACTLCGCEKLLFEPPVYFCNGINCQSQRIRRNSHFYIGGNNQYYWCNTCYNELDDKIPIELVDMSIMKSDLKKKKNDEVHEESWVQCDSCQRWVHQICGLFNTRQNKEHHSEYHCPKCMYEKRKKLPIPSPRPLSAEDLPRTALSEWLEQHILKKVENRKREIIEEKIEAESMNREEAMKYAESGGRIIIRQVTAMDRKLEVRELMQKRYAHKKYPEEFPFRCKCIVVFQELDGIDVLLFALYVYEHGEDNPPPNQRRIYISYLDSVHFMRPRKLRTFVYHEILIAYLDYVRRKGFSTAHIWACPPLKGDDYIFYAKPEDQKTPRDSRLRQWYIDMLEECQKRNIVGKVTNMYDLYFANENLDATAVPYLEGDYFPGEAENIIKMLEEGGGKKGGNGGKKKKKNKSKANKGNTGTRSGGVDEEALIASGLHDGIKSFKDLDRDQVMVKLGETIQPMKDSFIVAFLNWSGAKEEDMVVPEEIEKARIEYAAKEDGDLAGSKRDPSGIIRDASSKTGKDGRPVKVIDDDSEDLDCEFLNNRQAFLNLCRGNHYQFDEVRRAKHTSMMVLWHLHNRDAPKFVQQCVACSREILSGMRYHCNSCPDYDLCQECYKNPNTNRGACRHTLVPIAVEQASEERSGLTEAERQARQRNLMLHIQLIEHASRCTSKNCTSSNCAKMKSYLQHARSCTVKVQGGCKICKRIWTLLRIHAQKCKEPKCPIPQCIAIREKMRQLQKQQQAMDDRRRLEMNRHMHQRYSMTGAGGGH